MTELKGAVSPAGLDRALLGGPNVRQAGSLSDLWTNPYFFAAALPLHADDPQQPIASCLAVALPASAVQQLGQLSQHPAIALSHLVVQPFSLSQHAMPLSQQLISALQHSAPGLQHSAPGLQHSAPGLQHSAFATQQPWFALHSAVFPWFPPAA
jgi:hypothetical protein